MNKLSARNQLIIAAAVLVLIAVLVVMLGIMPAFQKAAGLAAESTTADTQLQSAQALLAQRESAKSHAAANDVELMDVSNSIPDAPDLPGVIIELQDAANAAGVDFVQITPTAPVIDAGQSYETVALTVVVHGDWADIIEFMRGVDKLTRGTRVTAGVITRVDSTSAGAGSTTAGSGSGSTAATQPYINAQLTLNVYVMSTSSTSTGQ